MILAKGLRNLALPAGGCVATIGNFDGVHLGHAAVIESVARRGRLLRLPVVAIVFEPQPREYFMPDQAPPRLTRFREKYVHLGQLPVDVVLAMHFDHRIADSPAEDFIRNVLVEGLRIKHLVVGDDFRFGKGRRGSLSMLKEAGAAFGFQVEDTDSVQMDGERVSSTLIREALARGDLEGAAQMLGRDYSIIGRVVQGARLGRELGFPTANIPMMRKKTPMQGVFAVTMTGISDHPLPGVANLGSKPTLEGPGRVQLEVHVFDFGGDIYGRLVEVHFHQKLRDERRFDSVTALREQIERDAVRARSYFSLPTL